MRIVPLILALLLVYPYLTSAQDKKTFVSSGDLIKKGIDLHEEGKYKEAIAVYNQVSRSDTNYVWSIYEAAMSYVADSQFSKGRSYYELALSLPEEREREPEIYNNYGSLLDDMGEHELAVEVLTKALNKYPSFGRLYVNKGLALIRLKRYAEAEALLKKGLLIDPYTHSCHYMLGAAALYQGKVIPAFLSFVGYLMMSPDGRYHNTAINLLNIISKNKEDLNEFVADRKTVDDDPYQMTEQIVLAKIALEKNYKPIIRLDDPISRQMQVVFEKLEYQEEVNDFWMQYYVPLFKSIYNNKEFETFVNHAFSAVNIEDIQNYNKKNKKENEKMISEIVDYLKTITSTRELNFEKRKRVDIHYYGQKGLGGKGKWKNDGEVLYGLWEFYFSAGNLKSTGMYNEAGEREGEWKYYYFNGDPKAIEHFKKGKLEGDFVSYYTNGNISAKAYYVGDLEEGEYSTFYRAGHQKVKQYYKKGKLNGERKEYYASGVLHILQNYRNDTLNGIYKTYHENGELEASVNYVNGAFDGLSKGFYDNGQVSFEGKYVAGKVEGEWKRYHENGKPKSIEHYVNDEVSGLYEEYHLNGMLHTKYEYKKGKMNGEISYFADDGKLYVIQTFDNNQLRSAKYFDKTGKLISSSETKNRKLDLTAFRGNGTKRYHAIFNEKGEVLSDESYFYTSGKLSETDGYENGKLNGPSISYHPNGKKNAEVPYQRGEKHGYSLAYYPHGQLQREGWYQENTAEGEWIDYDERGTKYSQIFLVKDEVEGYKLEYYPSGKVEFETRYQGGYASRLVQYDTLGNVLTDLKFPKGTGKIRLLHFNGKPYADYSYVNGLLQGEYKVYYFDGSIQTLQFYKGGQHDSIYRSYYYGGKISTEGSYRLGERTGLWKNFRLNGSLSSVDQYTNGALHGKRTYYYENGKIDTEQSYENGDRHGPTKKYTEEGSLLYVVNFEYGVPVSYTYPDASAKLLPNISLPGGNGKIQTYYANGKLSSLFEYADGKVNGQDMLYYPDGKPWMESTESFGSTEGKLKIYNPAGNLTDEYNYAYDNVHGPYKEYSQKGVLKEDGFYYNGLLHGEVRKYDEAGKLKETYLYYYGKLISTKK